MPCYSPLTGWRSRRANSNGKYTITFVKSEGYADKEVSLPCGACIGCRLEHARQWALRCVHESELHEENCFITLTYTEQKMPTLNGRPTLVKEHFQKFMKRLRKKFGDGIRYYACGEYGDSGSRGENPHYHACIFGLDFEDKILWQEKNGNKIYLSETLQDLWTDPEDNQPYGFVTVGSFSFETAGYVARYCMKKQKGKDKMEHYETVNLKTGEIEHITPEFALMSRRPGLGKSWLEKNQKEVTDNDSVIIKGREMKPPKYYDYLIERQKNDDYEQMKADRRAAAKKAIENNSLARLHVRGIVKKAQTNQLKKEL